MEQKSKALPIILIILLVLVLCCIVISVGLIAGGVWLNDKVNTSGGYNFPTETVTITEVTPETTTNKPVPDEAIETLDTLEQTIVPINDPVELAERLGGKLNVPDTLIDPDAPYSVGARKPSGSAIRTPTRTSRSRRCSNMLVKTAISGSKKGSNMIPVTLNTWEISSIRRSSHRSGILRQRMESRRGWRPSYLRPLCR